MKAGHRPHLTARAPFVAHWRAAGLYSGITLDQAIQAGVAKSPGATIVIEGDGRNLVTTTAAMYAESQVIAETLAGMGFSAGDVIAVQLPNCRENFLTLLAALRLGLVFLPIVMIYGATELGFILRQSGARALVVTDRWRNADLPQRIGSLPSLPALERIFVVGTDGMPGPVMHWEEMARQPRAALPAFPAEADDICLINYTSGTTSSPKGVMHTHNSLLCEMQSNCAMPGLPGNCGLSVPAAGHIGGVTYMLTPFLRAQNLIVLNLWQEDRVLELIREYRVEKIGSVPVRINFLLDLKEIPPTIRAASTGGAGVPPALVERGDARGVRIIRSFGTTEHPTVTAGLVTDSLEKRAHTDGRVTEWNQVRILDDDGREVPRGEQGEITTMGPELFAGYFDESLDANTFTPDGWYKTGDIGIMDAEGFVSVVDRKKDIIIRGGENISSQEVEGIMARHPAVREAVAVAWPDPVYSERVGVFVLLRPGHSLDIPAVQAHFAAQGVARQKTPERLVVVEDFQRNATGKVLKPVLRKRVAEIVAAERGETGKR